MKVISSLNCLEVFTNDFDVIVDSEIVKLYCGSDIIEIYPRDKKIIIKNNHIKRYEY